MVSPPQLTTGRAVGQFFEAPGKPLHGTVTFTASISHASAPVAEPNPFTVLPRPQKGVIDSQGFLSTPGSDSLAGERGVVLVAVDNPELSTVGWHWVASIRQTDEEGNWLATLPSFPVHILTGEDTDLSRSMRLPAGNVLSVDQSKALADAAERHAAEAKGFAGEAAVSSAEAAKAAETAVVEVREVAGQVAGKLDADTAADTFQTKTDAKQTATELAAAVAEAKEAADKALANGNPLIPDPDNPGFFFIAPGGPITPDPANPGLYFIGA